MWTSIIILPWFWNWLLQDILSNIVIIGMAFALLFNAFVFKVFVREKLTIECWRAILYRRISNGIDRLHQDIIVLRQQMELDEIWGVSYYKPILKEQYQEKLDLLKQELISLEKVCHQYPQQRNRSQQKHISQSEDKTQGIKLTGRTSGLEIMVNDEVHPRIRWYEECTRDFHQWIQSSEFYKWELYEGISPLNHYRKGVKSSKVPRDQDLEYIKFGGYLPFPCPRTLCIEYSAMLTKQKPDMAASLISGASELQAWDMLKSVATETMDIVFSVVIETLNIALSVVIEALNITFAVVIEALNIIFAVVIMTHFLAFFVVIETLDISDSVANEIVEKAGSVTREILRIACGVANETMDMPDKACSVVNENLGTPDIAFSVVNETLDITGSVSKNSLDIPDIADSVANETLFITDMVAKETLDITSSVANETMDMPDIAFSVVNETLNIASSIANETLGITGSVANETLVITGSVANETLVITGSVANETLNIADIVANETLAIRQCCH